MLDSRETSQIMAFVSVTRLRLRASRYLPHFLWFTVRSYWQARFTEGNISIKLLRDAGQAYWTKSVWRDEAAMRSYMLSGAHRKVMPYLLEWCDEAHVVHWTQESEEAPSWLEGHRRMVTEGRKSKLTHPSSGHDSMGFPPPAG